MNAAHLPMGTRASNQLLKDAREATKLYGRHNCLIPRKWFSIPIFKVHVFSLYLMRTTNQQIFESKPNILVSVPNYISLHTYSTADLSPLNTLLRFYSNAHHVLRYIDLNPSNITTLKCTYKPMGKCGDGWRFQAHKQKSQEIDIVGETLHFGW